mmetsp:Transcript_55135/g.124113  ORF Transcript_55135/g.124113 Transcript_55135/m.124113 type:complete len:202 (+) Transcript_55135:1065-1670(+)
MTLSFSRSANFASRTCSFSVTPTATDGRSVTSSSSCHRAGVGVLAISWTSIFTQSEGVMSLESARERSARELSSSLATIGDTTACCAMATCNGLLPSALTVLTSARACSRRLTMSTPQPASSATWSRDRRCGPATGLVTLALRLSACVAATRSPFATACTSLSVGAIVPAASVEELWLSTEGSGAPAALGPIDIAALGMAC